MTGTAPLDSVESLIPSSGGIATRQRPSVSVLGRDQVNPPTAQVTSTPATGLPDPSSQRICVSLQGCAVISKPTVATPAPGSIVWSTTLKPGTKTITRIVSLDQGNLP